ncbi:MAG: hypothetical protein HY904_18885 [Deltaproteobacteria bacterium]|nr:hypothetical protein [Deltaproteobacteria bacterium]
MLYEGGAAGATGLCLWEVQGRGQLDLGAVTTSAAGSEDIAFEVPAGTGSFTVVLEDDDGLRLGARRLVAPDGTVVLNADDEASDLNPGTVYVGVASVLVPSGDDPRAGAIPGRWTLRVATYALDDTLGVTPIPGNVERIRVLTEPVGVEGGAVDLHLSFSPALGVSFTAPSADAWVTALLGRVAAYLERAHLVLGTVTFAHLGGHDEVPDGNAARALCTAASSTGLAGRSVNLFLVQDLAFTSGFSGGIPGPPETWQSPGSGIVLESMGSGDATGILAAHELFHFMGLRHTTELSGGGRDPLSDTPECPRGTSLESCPDYGNLMFPSFPLRGDLDVSAAQTAVLWHSPWAHRVVRGACGGGMLFDVTGPDRAILEVASLPAGPAGCGAQAGGLVFRPPTQEALSISVRTDADLTLAVGTACGDASAGCVEVAAGTARVLEVPAPVTGPVFVALHRASSSEGGWVDVRFTRAP